MENNRYSPMKPAGFREKSHIDAISHRHGPKIDQGKGFEYPGQFPVPPGEESSLVAEVETDPGVERDDQDLKENQAGIRQESRLPFIESRKTRSQTQADRELAEHSQAKERQQNPHY